MSELLKHAILDTDFVSKANVIKTEDRVLADEVPAFPDYKFFCHHKMLEELDDHGSLVGIYAGKYEARKDGDL